LYLGIPLFHEVRINQSSFVSEMFWAFVKVFTENTLGIGLKVLGVLLTNGVPKSNELLGKGFVLRFTMVEIVCSIKVHVLFVPSKESFP